MDIILYYIRDNIVSVHYFIYAFVCLFLMFAIIGYLFKQKYAKLTINVSSSQPKKNNKENVAKQVNQTTTKNNQVVNQTPTNQPKIPEVKPMPANPNNQVKPTITPNNNNQINPTKLNNQTK